MPAAKKLTPKKTRISKAAPKKAAVTKTTSTNTKAAVKNKALKTVPVRKTTKKESKKSVSSPATKRLRNKASSKKVEPKKNTAKTRKDTQNIVQVPKNVPLRSIEKAEVLRSELSLYWQKSMYRVAIVSGFCFLLLGSVLSGADVLDTTSTVNNSAQVVSSGSEEVAPNLTLYSTVPDILDDATRVLFTIQSVYPESVEYSLLNVDTKVATPRKKAENLQDSKYVFLLSPKNLSPGHYKIQIRYKEKGLVTNDNNSAIVESVAQFLIPEQDTTVDVLDPSTDNSITLDDSHVSSTQQIEPINKEVKDNTATSTDTNIITDGILESATEFDDAATTTQLDRIRTDTDVEPEIKTTETPVAKEQPVKEKAKTPLKEPVVDDNKKEDPLEKEPSKNFSLLTKETTVSGLLTIELETTGFTNLKLYTRPMASLYSRFMTEATQRSGTNVFIVNTKKFLPNGKYEFYVKGEDATGQEQITPSITVTVKNKAVVAAAPVVVDAQSPRSSDQEPEPTAIFTPKKPVSQERDFAEIDFDTPIEDLPANDIKNASERLINQDSENLTQLLNKYASAQQSGDEMLIKAAREALTEQGIKLSNSALVDQELAGISDDVGVHVTEKIADLLNRVDTFEQIRKEKSGGQTALDADEDGIPDFDEVNLYQTDPNNPDTDGDGFTDGIEIMRGFDPLDDTAEAAIAFESPKEAIALIQDALLKVEEVIPSINSIAEDNDEIVRTEIRGRGLPNSFITLYIFSTPTIVTIKTDVDGSFVYTLDKELADGTHDVFVALTDNTGSILAKSNPFSFIKEAQAFTPVDAAAGDVIGSDKTVQSVISNSYKTVVGVGLLAFGLILLMLGVSLRTRKDDVLASGRIINEGLDNGGLKTPPTSIPT